MWWAVKKDLQNEAIQYGYKVEGFENRKSYKLIFFFFKKKENGPCGKLIYKIV